MMDRTAQPVKTPVGEAADGVADVVDRASMAHSNTTVSRASKAKASRGKGTILVSRANSTPKDREDRIAAMAVLDAPIARNNAISALGR